MEAIIYFIRVSTQAVRNMDDLETMACPAKYRSMQTFYKYYSGEKVAPYPTIFSECAAIE